MKMILIPVGLLLLVGGLTAGGRIRLERPKKVLAFDSMYGVDGPFLDEDNAINGVEGDELPWVVRSAHGTLLSDGTLEVHVRGLVLTKDDKVPSDLQGTNPDETFRVLLSCLTEDEQGHVVPTTVETAGFHASEDGNSDIDANIDLPVPCVAPILFVMSGTEDKWFAVTGFEEGDD